MSKQNHIVPSFWIIVLSVMLLVGQGVIPRPGYAFTLPDTGQTACYDDTQEITCPAPDEPYYGQDAQYSTCGPSYTDNGNGTVTDNCTGLMWQQVDDDFERKYQTALSYCENLTLGDHTDWRVPYFLELQEIVDYGTHDPAVDPTYFPGTSGWYWTSSIYAPSPNYIWLFLFSNGEQTVINPVYSFYTRCVRGQSNAHTFTYNGDLTVTDNLTGLMWQQVDDDNLRSWPEALAYCESLTLADYTDWRLPDAKQLTSIADRRTYNPAINTVFFPGTNPSGYYWSSTTYVFAPGHVWAIAFYDGELEGEVSKSASMYVRCVRSGAPHPCKDNDDDGYGNPASTNCDYAELDCDDSDPLVNPGETENCTNGIDDNCNGAIDGADCDCGGYPCTANAEAASYGSSSVTSSGIFNELILLVIPVGAVIILSILRRRR